MELERFKSNVIPLREKLQSFAGSILPNDFEAQDAVQETFLRLWNVRSQLENHPNIGGFAMQTLKNICIDKLRSTRYKLSNGATDISDNTLTPYQYTEQKNEIAIIRRIIDTLPPTQRMIIMMRDVEGYELDEIAEITGSDSNAIRVNLSRARKAVRDKFMNLVTV
ncbi:MAG: sigma-70 family RNA polymerase sigma factor [Prevotella sp.]|jgi:RNA polymerase sigma-70 factor (ECF subfamily)|nr:sigma-70 family RNA polymerase sigma factor [Prevotella sp.]